MAEKGLAVMPDPAGVMGKADLVAWSDEPISLWTNVRIEDVRLIPLGDCVAALVYRGSAQRDGQAYTANISSVYVERDGSWQLLLHQQSPPMTQP
jgi:ketosteroid isomerase-like protein